MTHLRIDSACAKDRVDRGREIEILITSEAHVVLIVSKGPRSVPNRNREDKVRAIVVDYQGRIVPSRESFQEEAIYKIGKVITLKQRNLIKREIVEL